MNNNVSDALTRYWEVRNLPQFNPEPLIAYALNNGLVPTAERGYEGLWGLLQVLACLAESDHPEVPLVIAKGDVLAMYTALHGKNFSLKCSCHTHFKLHHHFHRLDLGGLTSTEVVEAGGVIYTLGQLSGNFDTELAGVLTDWTTDYDKSELEPGAIIWAKGWMHEVFPFNRQEMFSIIHRWNQYVY